MTNNIVYGMVSDSQVSTALESPQSQGDIEMTNNIVYGMVSDSQVSQPQVPQSPRRYRDDKEHCCTAWLVTHKCHNLKSLSPQGDIEMTKNIVYGMVSDSQVSQPQVPQSQGDIEMTNNIVYGMVSDSQVSQPQVPSVPRRDRDDKEHCVWHG